ncbi:carboxylating nicotinate-nucleotide diphosphorylase [Elusimicrobiota bacterium]
MILKNSEIEEIVNKALEEDHFRNDITSRALKYTKKKISARIIARENCIFCGSKLLEQCFKSVSTETELIIKKKDGTAANSGEIIAEITGNPVDILAAERTALNFISHLSAISTLTGRFVDIVKKVSPACKVLDTRKTVPGLRYLEKYAVAAGGGENHRLNLSEMALIKENHLYFSENGITGAALSVKENTPEGTKIEIEVENLAELDEALESEADIIMLDNFSMEDIRAAKGERDTRAPEKLLEVSGGINLRNVEEIAGCGIDRISIGMLTKAVGSIDYSLLVLKE